MRKCVTKRAPSSSSGRGSSLPSPCMKFQVRNFFDGARHAEGRDERSGARERAEEEGRIRRRPRGTRRDESEAGRDARYLRIQIKNPGRHVRAEKKSGVVYRSSSYLTARLDSEIYLAPSPSLVSRGCDRTRSLDRRIESTDVIHSRFSWARIFCTYMYIQVCLHRYKQEIFIKW